MKIELEWPEDEILVNHIFAPHTLGGPAFRHLPEDDASRPWLVYVKSVKSPTYFGAQGFGMTPQRAVDDGLRQVREYLARNPEGAYNTKTPGITLDLTGLLDGL